MDLATHELKNRFKATWLALDAKDKQAHPFPQGLTTSPDANPSGPPFHEGFKTIPELWSNREYASLKWSGD